MAKSYLHVQTTKAIWTDTTASLHRILNNIDVWRIPVATLIPHLTDLQTLLSLPEIEKINRYQLEIDRQSRTVSKAVLRILLGRYLAIDPAEISFKLDQNKKPELQNILSKKLHFNVSHSGDWILIALAENPVGVDVEKINASFTYQNLLDFSFSLEEKFYIESNVNPPKSFYKLWTRKEALLKATGKGLTDDLSLVPSLDGIHQNPSNIIASNHNWQITSFEVDENHLASTVFMSIKTALQFFNFQL